MFVLRLLFRSAKDFYNDDCAQMAATISYYTLFSIFPFLIFLLTMVGVFLHERGIQEQLVSAIVEWIPSLSNKNNILIDSIRNLVSQRRETAGVMGIAFLLWSASSVSGTIRSSINAAYNLDVRKSLVVQKLLDLLMVLVGGLFLLLSFVASSALQFLQSLGEEWAVRFPLPALTTLIGEKGILWNATSRLLPMLLTFVVFYALYWVMPAKRLKFLNVLPGAVAGTFLFELFKEGFLLYLRTFGRYDLIFGSLGNVVAFLFWVYLSAMALLFGAEVASEYERELNRTRPNEQAGI